MPTILSRGLGLISGGVLGPQDQAPQMQIPQDSPQLQDMRNRATSESQASTQDLINRQLNGADKASNGLLAGRAHANDQRNASLGMSDPALSDALANRSRNHFNQNFNTLKQQVAIDAPSMRMNRLKQMTGALTKEGAVQRLSAQKQYENAAETYKTRQQVISNVLSEAGAAAGYAVAGSAGAALGSQAGGKGFGV